MPRANRRYLPGYIWHLTHRSTVSRANGRELECFEAFQDSVVLREPAAIYKRLFGTKKQDGGRNRGHL
jgi:hypothetical protein